MPAGESVNGLYPREKGKERGRRGSHRDTEVKGKLFSKEPHTVAHWRKRLPLCLKERVLRTHCTIAPAKEGKQKEKKRKMLDPSPRPSGINESVPWEEKGEKCCLHDYRGLEGRKK